MYIRRVESYTDGVTPWGGGPRVIRPAQHTRVAGVSIFRLHSYQYWKQFYGLELGTGGNPVYLSVRRHRGLNCDTVMYDSV